MTKDQPNRSEWEALREEIKTMQAQIVLLTEENRRLSNSLLEMSEVLYA